MHCAAGYRAAAAASLLAAAGRHVVHVDDEFTLVNAADLAPATTTAPPATQPAPVTSKAAA